MIEITKEDADIIYELIKNHDDQGPWGYGYQSIEFMNLISRIKEAVEGGSDDNV
jgi:hypothetical protein